MSISTPAAPCHRSPEYDTGNCRMPAAASGYRSEWIADAFRPSDGLTHRRERSSRLICPLQVAFTSLSSAQRGILQMRRPHLIPREFPFGRCQGCHLPCHFWQPCPLVIEWLASCGRTSARFLSVIRIQDGEVRHPDSWRHRWAVAPPGDP